MSKIGGSNGAVSEAGTEFHLSDEILSVMPTDPYQQLDLARKITSLAIASRVSNLESEVSRMRQKLHDRDRTISDLEDRVAQAQRALQDSDSKLKLSLDDNVKLANERDSLAMSVKKLSRDLAKLETFKRQLMQSLNDDISSHGETVDIGTCDQSVTRVQTDKEEGLNGYALQHSFFRSTSTGNSIDEASKVAGQRLSITPYITSRLTPTGTPKVISTSVSPRGYSTAGSPQKTSGRTTPTKPHYEEKNALSSWYTSSQQSSAANSPPRVRSMPGHTPRIDGKEFFRQARSRLSYEQFSAFLANIKELNAHKQTREETLRRAEEIFGTESKDLYLSFQGLLNRNVH